MDPGGPGAPAFSGLHVASQEGDQNSKGCTKQDYSLSFHTALGMVTRKLLPVFRVWCGLSRVLSWCHPPHGEDNPHPGQGSVFPREGFGVPQDKAQCLLGQESVSPIQDKAQCPPRKDLVSPRTGLGHSGDISPCPRTRWSVWDPPPSSAPLLSPPTCVAGSGDISTCGIPEEDVFQVFPRFLLPLHVA